MKQFDTILPYILASMDPIMHMSLLTSSLILHGFNYDQFFKIPGEATCDATVGSKAKDFIDGGKYTLIGYISFAHVMAIVLHYLGSLLKSQSRRQLGNLCQLAKVFTYLFIVQYVQTAIIFEDCRDGVVNESQVMAWLNYEVLAFYMNIVAMGVFLLLSSCKKFKSFRDRLGMLSDDARKT